MIGDTGVEVVHRCFPEGGNCILSIFSLERSCKTFAITRPPHVSLLFDLILPSFQWLTLVVATRCICYIRAAFRGGEGGIRPPRNTTSPP